MKVILIDNNDSFTYNLAHYIMSFNVKLDVIRISDITLNHVVNYDKILISPGPGVPHEYPLIFDIIDKYYINKPILGVCLGHQIIGQYFNAELINLKEVLHGVKSSVHHYGNCSLFNNVPSDFHVGHYHSWVISDNKLPKCLEITSLNNKNLIMSFKHKRFDVKGLQFHPESILTDFGLQILKNWIDF
ncbi:MAG: aminodeoxychorismate/anthranilate synthase component II [Flavobacteriales bacterium]|nr:aminodeoxychorismate/anthranilate synthase component II [Flavobacteriales bacterium]